MNTLVLSSLLLLISSVSVHMKPSFNLPRLGVAIREETLRYPRVVPSASSSSDLKTFFYNQTLDHFNYNPDCYTTFPQKYMMSTEYWGGAAANAPIFVYFGAEAPLDEDKYFVGFLSDNARHFQALIVYIEHRFYGESKHLKSIEEVLKNATIRGYFNSAQAIADYAEVLTYLKETLNAKNSPTIVIGGSYGGMLASWFRLKYPHIAIGALASSAPILYFDDITPQNGYSSIITKDFKEASESCYETIRASWTQIQQIGSTPDGLSFLTSKFRTCSPLNNASELINYLVRVYRVAAQYDDPPYYPVSSICSDINGGSRQTDILSRIVAGLVAYIGNRSCYHTTTLPTETNLGWQWQTCSEMVMPIDIATEKDSMLYPPTPFNLSSFIEDCKSVYGVSPRPHWVTTNYGGHNIQLVLRKFASNIIFSNGLRDPYSSGGVLQNISDSVVAISTLNGSHCLDILIADQRTDPEWLVMQRKAEVKIIEGWISQYYSDLSISNVWSAYVCAWLAGNGGYRGYYRSKGWPDVLRLCEMLVVGWLRRWTAWGTLTVSDGGLSRVRRLLCVRKGYRAIRAGSRGVAGVAGSSEMS
ncbi:uncharacterized protein LOC131148157 [Malania oleifera]|uniref:uncharacterized protein LOC131148157 n=1 Tax=Malania oleifera TaxID=397392 RepID=UPI0025AE0D78|nr:uncharacterized protein LOC131148157 [Malania oleifera]